MTRIKCLVIPADLEEAVTIKEIDQGDLSAMQAIVGGLVQVIDLEAQHASLWANEEGKNINLPLNQRASMALWLSSSRWRHQDYIAGDAFLTGLPDDEGGTTSTPTELLNLMVGATAYKVEVQTVGGGNSWSGNSLTFDDYWDAAHSVLDLASRWQQVTEARVVSA